MKSLLTISIGTTCMALCSFAQATLFDSFDYGTGIDGRADIETGDTITNVDVLNGPGTWTTFGSANRPSFAGAEGLGNGYLDITTTTNGGASTTYDFNSGVISATINFTFTSGDLYFGFQVAEPAKNLIGNQSTDKSLVQISDSGIEMRTLVDGTQIADSNSYTWSSGDAGQLTMTYDVANKTVTSIVSSGGTEQFNITQTIESGATVDFGGIAINSLVAEATIQDFSVIPEPQAFAVTLGALALIFVCGRRK